MRLAVGSALVVVAFGAVLGLASGPVQAAPAADDTATVPRYERAPCMTELPNDFVDGQNAAIWWCRSVMQIPPGAPSSWR
jgi:hypothetical protein